MDHPLLELPYSFGAYMIILGLLVFTQSFFIISISHDLFLWHLVIVSIDKSPWNLLISYVMLGFSFTSIAVGTIILVFKNPKTDEVIKKIDMSKWSQYTNKMKKSTKFYYSFAFFAGLEFFSTAVLCFQGLKYIELPLKEQMEELLAGILFWSLAMMIVFNYLADREQKNEKSTLV